MPDLFETHSRQLNALVRSHEINVIGGVNVESVDIVNVRYTHMPHQREFTALITARATDYYIDDRTREFRRGDQGARAFQEFWTFQRQDDSWLLREIEQSRESDALKDENFFEQLTDHGRDEIYADAAGKAGPAGPWLEQSVETKATRIDRMLNFLVQTDKIWNREQMIRRAGDAFTNVMLALESGNVADIPEAYVMPAFAEALRKELEHRRHEGITQEFRNLCVRKVELVLIQNYLDDTKDEFTTRISAHAQRFMTKNGRSLQADEYVMPFEEFWVFGRLKGEWNVKEVLPPSRSKESLSTENLDEDSTPEQVQSYYQHTRAN